MYNELYNACHLKLDWLNELCSHDHDVIIEVTSDKLFNYENQPESKKKDSEVSIHD